MTVTKNGHSRKITLTVSSSIDIAARPETVWEQITNVKMEQFSDPLLFRILGIPRPLKADLLSEGLEGKRIAYFAGGKKFVQEITSWKPYAEYSFTFNPSRGFVVGHFFDLSDGIFRVPRGAYFLTAKEAGTALQLSTTYSLDVRFYYLLHLPVRIILKAFQKYLLSSIKRNCM